METNRHKPVVGLGVLVEIAVVTVVPAEVNLVVVFSVVVAPLVVVVTDVNSSGKQPKIWISMTETVSAPSVAITGTILTAVATTALGIVVSIRPSSLLS